MTDTRVRWCSRVVLAVQAAALVATLLGHDREPYVAALATAVQVGLALVALGIASGAWLVARPRGATLAWLLAMPLVGAAASAASLAVLASMHWGC